MCPQTDWEAAPKGVEKRCSKGATPTYSVWRLYICRNYISIVLYPIPAPVPVPVEFYRHRYRYSIVVVRMWHECYPSGAPRNMN